MNQYGRVALRAVDICSELNVNPRNGWENSAEEIISSKSSRDKVCPKSTFLGLCEQGYVKGIPSGKYLSGQKVSSNKEYALRAVELLRDNKELCKDKRMLWNMVTNGEKAHNSQMDVVISLFENGLILSK